MVEIAGTPIARGQSVIHFYYSDAERRRFLSLLTEGLALDEAVVLGCSSEGLAALGDPFKQVDRRRRTVLRVELNGAPGGVGLIADAARLALRRRTCGRVLADFGATIPIERILETEAALGLALSGLPLICLTQYDGRSVPAPLAIEQFRTHALAIIGNVLHNVNQDYISPANYLRKRAVGGR